MYTIVAHAPSPSGGYPPCEYKNLSAGRALRRALSTKQPQLQAQQGAYFVRPACPSACCPSARMLPMHPPGLSVSPARSPIRPGLPISPLAYQDSLRYTSAHSCLAKQPGARPTSPACPYSATSRQHGASARLCARARSSATHSRDGPSIHAPTQPKHTSIARVTYA